VQPAWESNAKRDRGKCRPEEEKYIDGKIGKNHVAGRSLYTTSVIENNTSVEVAMREDTRGENRASILAVLKQEAIASVNQPRNPQSIHQSLLYFSHLELMQKRSLDRSRMSPLPMECERLPRNGIYRVYPKSSFLTQRRLSNGSKRSL
jgi:hypothetical protein